MVTVLKEVDAVVVGMGWTGSILSRELTKAGFQDADHIGPYLRSLIESHHDTLATPVR